MTDEERKIIIVNAQELSARAMDIRRTDSDENVQDCERRIDRLCQVVEDLAQLVASVARRA